MRHKIILGLSALLIVGSMGLAVHENKSALQTAKVHAASVTNQAKQEAVTRQKLQSQISTDNQEIVALQSQCQISMKNYSLLTTIQLPRAVKPDCSL